MRQRAIPVGVRVGWPEAVAFAMEIAQALAHVHERSGVDGSPLGIVHRDLSPQNVMVGYTGEVKLIDFGTARGHNRRCRTVAGVVFAKPGYVAPEVARQQVGDGRIDVYALGIILWELCAGRRFLSCDPQRHLDDAAAGKVQVARIAAASGAPAELDDVIAKLTHNEPDERYARASLMGPDLAKLLAAAPELEGGERGVRARLAHRKRKLWPHEPGRSRSEFARLLRDARETLRQTTRSATTPAAGPVSEALAARLTPSDPAVVLGTPYRLGARLGEGASGVVWEAEHVELGRKVALKILAPEHASSAAALERFRREARAVAGMSHPNLVQILDFGKSLDGRVYLAMELLSGQTLDVRLRARPMTWRRAVELGVAACNALSAAHAAGLVHRDIKPQNLMLTEGGELKLLDFGVAMALTDGSDRKPTDKEKALRGFAIFGTPEYMAPEQVAGETVDGRTDVYALGCVLYEMLTGTRAFEGGSSVVVMGKQLRDTPPPPRVRMPARAIPRALDAIVVRAMATRPDDRFPSAGALRDALQETLLGPARVRARTRRVASVASVAAAFVVAALLSARWARTQSVDPASLPAATLGAVAHARRPSHGPGARACVHAPLARKLPRQRPRSSSLPCPCARRAWPRAPAADARAGDVGPRGPAPRRSARGPPRRRRMVSARRHPRTEARDRRHSRRERTPGRRAGRPAGVARDPPRLERRPRRPVAPLGRRRARDRASLRVRCGLAARLLVRRPAARYRKAPSWP